MNFYNEIDPSAASWLRELIACGAIPEGHVEEQSIVLVRCSSFYGRFEQCHWFAGIGGWARALALAGWPEDRPVWTASLPCQPFSIAGKQRGTDDDRHLWPVFRNLVEECLPPTIFGEQVASPDGRIWLSGVRSDLEALGYAVGGIDCCAAGIGAPHIRQRLYWVATRRVENANRPIPELTSRGGSGSDEAQGTGSCGEPDRSGDAGRMANSGGERLDGCGQQDGERDEGRPASQLSGEDSGLGHPDSAGREPREPASTGTGHWDPVEPAGADGGLAYSAGHAGSEHEREPRDGSRGIPEASDPSNDRGDHGMADGQQSGLEGHTGNGDDGNQPGRIGTDAPGSTPEGGSLGFWSDFEWIYCRDGKWRRTQSSIFPLAHGIPRGMVPSGDPGVETANASQEGRKTRLKGYGNAIVPQLAAEFIKAFLELESP